MAQRRSSAQSAMEYLMTYGWAILIIAVVLAVLFQLGVFSGGNFTPKAQAGACQVQKTAVGSSLVGECQGQLPEFVAKFEGNGAIIVSKPSENDGFPNGYTMSAWVSYVSPVSVCGYAVGIEDSSALPRGGAVLSCNSQPSPYGETINQANYAASAPGSQPTLPFGTWEFIAVAWNPTAQTITFYLNGAQYGASVSDTVLPVNMIMTTPHYVVGGQTNGGSWNGYEADAQMYNTSLSSNEIQSLYQEGIGGAPIRPQNIVGWWPLNGNANDYSGNNNNGAGTNVGYSSSWQSGYTAP